MRSYTINKAPVIVEQRANAKLLLEQHGYIAKPSSGAKKVSLRPPGLPQEVLVSDHLCVQAAYAANPIVIGNEDEGAFDKAYKELYQQLLENKQVR